MRYALINDFRMKKERIRCYVPDDDRIVRPQSLQRFREIGGGAGGTDVIDLKPPRLQTLLESENCQHVRDIRPRT